MYETQQSRLNKARLRNISLEEPRLAARVHRPTLRKAECPTIRDNSRQFATIRDNLRKWETILLDPVFRLGLNQRLGFPATGAGQQCGRTLPGVSDASTFLIPMDDMPRVAPKVFTHAATTAYGTSLPSLPGKQA